jgi:hypothetical protein
MKRRNKLWMEDSLIGSCILFGLRVVYWEWHWPYPKSWKVTRVTFRTHRDKETGDLLRVDATNVWSTGGED